MLYYKYDASGKLLFSAEADISPITGQALLPVNSTTTAPPEALENHYVVFIDTEWTQIPINPKTNDEIISELTKAIENHYDSVAKQKNYDDRYTCAMRAGITGSPFQQEGINFGVWMDNCNAYAYQVMSDCLTGLRKIPTPVELIAELPVAPW